MSRQDLLTSFTATADISEAEPLIKTVVNTRAHGDEGSRRHVETTQLLFYIAHLGMFFVGVSLLK